MKQALSENIRSLRERRSWTQEQVAQVAQVNLRTIQRAEAAQGASAETLLALGGALNVDIDQLRFDAMASLARELGVLKDELTPELLAQTQKRSPRGTGRSRSRGSRPAQTCERSPMP